MIYASAPRRWGFLAYDALRGGRVRAHLRDLEETVADAAVARERRRLRLDRILRHAAATTPFYGSCDPARGLAGFPITSRNQVQTHYDEFRSRAFAGKRLARFTTSGSSGDPLGIDLAWDKRARQIAEYVFFSRWAGFDLGVRHALVRTKPKILPVRLAQNQYVMNPIRLSFEELERWRAVLRRGRIKVLVGHPSTLDPLARFCEASGDGPEDFAGLHGIITVGETLFPPTRERIGAVFGIPPLSRYAAVELGVLAHEVPGDGRHVLNPSGYVIEVLRLDDDEPAGPGERGRVVVTDLLAEAVPLIRYDIGDLAVLADDVDRHGLPMLDRIEGRSRDIITAADGTPMSPFAVGYFLKGIEGIGRYQFIQEAAGRYRIRIVPMEGFDTEATIRAGLEEILGEGAELDIEYADRILLLPSGKASDVTVLSRFEETEDGASGR